MEKKKQKIFIILGSQKFQFNRLLKMVDDLIIQGVIQDEVFAQSGYSDYIPKCYAYRQFLDREEFAQIESNADIIITHGGTGAIIGAIKNGKKVIAVPRLAKYGEHVDDHQLQLIAQFRNQNLILEINNCRELEEALKSINKITFNNYQSNTKKYLEYIKQYIKDIEK